MINTPSVMIYIPTMNRLPLLNRAINSVMSQSYENIELIVVDNGSSDGTVEYLKDLSLKNPKLKVIFFDSNRGACAARNAAINMSTSTFVTGLDDDDYIAKNRIEKFVDVSAMYDVPLFDDDTLMKENGRKTFKKPDVVFYDDMFSFNYIGNQLFARRELYVNAGLFDEQLSSCQDYDMWLRMLSISKLARNIKQGSQIVDISHDVNRISMSSKKRSGIRRFYLKHKSKMTVKQRKIQLLRYFYQTRQGMSLVKYLSFFNFDFFYYRAVILLRSVIMKSKVKM